MSKAEIKHELKKMFGNNAWFISDEDYITNTYKIDWFAKCGKGTISVINCEDNRHLNYNNNYWGSDAYISILKKFGLGMEWYDNCFAYIFYDKDYANQFK